MTFTIRKMVAGDIAAVQQVAKVSWHHTYEGIIPFAIQENFLKFTYNDGMLQKRLAQSLMFVAEIEGQVVGFANFVIGNEGEVELSAIYLDPAYQGQGIGSELLQTGIQQLTDAKAVFVDVEKENTIGTSFYEAKGFQVVAEFDDDFDGHVLKTVRMVRKVSNRI